MKRLISVLLACLLCFIALTACGSKTITEPSAMAEGSVIVLLPHAVSAMKQSRQARRTEISLFMLILSVLRHGMGEDVVAQGEILVTQQMDTIGGIFSI